MRNILKIVALFGLVCTAGAQGTSEAVSGYTLPATSGIVAGTAGWAFQPTTYMDVTSLGVLQYLVANQGSMQVGLWDNTGQLLGSTSIATTNPLVNLTLYGPISQVLLNPGVTYRVGLFSATGSEILSVITQGIDGSATLSSAVHLVGAAAGTGGFGYPGNLGGSGTMVLGPNFQYRPTVPEPSAMALVALGGLACVYFRKNGPRR